GHTISFLAKNGRQVLAALEQVEVDAVLMDCQMPELDGYETTREIRRREGERPRLWIVAMTANTMEGDREKCLSAGMDDYVSKPLNEIELMDVLARVPAKPHKAFVGGDAVDPVALARLRELGGAEGEALLVILVEQFIQSGKELIIALGEALAAVDFIAAAQAVHALGGCAANFGAKFLVSACTRAEHAANTQNLASAQDCAEAILREYDLVRIALLAASLRNKNIQDENINC
ncbi:MAG: response regulator, partial [Proteobacteria bacterium]|nr:response regulator [Pseudomonadota bacterium]